MKYIYLILSVLLLATFSCKQSTSENSSNNTQITEKSTKKYKLDKITNYPTWPNSSIALKENLTRSNNGKLITKFEYEIKNFELGAQTDDALDTGLANSAKGQHIHLILNNKPYMAHYNSGFKVELEKGAYTALAFLSRSYHMSLKNKAAFNLTQFVVGDDIAEPEVIKGKNMFYSRPKGTYVGNDAKEVMLDFFLINTELGSSGDWVKATINGEVHKINEWAPFKITGMPMGENTIKLELMDENGDWIPGPFNSVERSITLSEK